ncbi:MAG TPA: hypothetical protein VLF89_09735 [Candidatus Saccharimonadales bacterium]|nr:hypothetical protein [Candidatus Saccharimonadales bacterium]
MGSSFPTSIQVTAFYDKAIQKITGTKSDPIIVSKGMTFLMLLFNIFASYPEIEKKYPPGKLGLLLNGKPPTDFDILQDGDKVLLIGEVV